MSTMPRQRDYAAERAASKTRCDRDLRALTLGDAGRMSGIRASVLVELPGLPPLGELPDGRRGWTAAHADAMRLWCTALAVRELPCTADDWPHVDPLATLGDYTVADMVLLGLPPADIVSESVPGGELPPLTSLSSGAIGWAGPDAISARLWARRAIASGRARPRDDDRADDA